MTHKELEQIDQDISFTLNTFQKMIEGQKRGIPHSKEKVKRREVFLHWKSRMLKA